MLGAGMCTAEVTIMSESELRWYCKNKLEAEQIAGCSAAPFFIGGARFKRRQQSVKHYKRCKGKKSLKMIVGKILFGAWWSKSSAAIIAAMSLGVSEV